MEFLMALALTAKGLEFKREDWGHTYLVVDSLGYVRDSHGYELYYEDMLAVDWIPYDEEEN